MTQTTSAKPQITKVGNLTKDFELKTSASGTVYAHSSIAVNRPGPSGTYDDKITDYYDITVFKNTAENAAASLHKGDQVIVVGTGETREYQTKDGETKTGKSIAANYIGVSLQFATVTVTRVKASGNAGAGSAAKSGGSAEAAKTDAAGDDDDF